MLPSQLKRVPIMVRPSRVRTVTRSVVGGLRGVVGVGRGGGRREGDGLFR